jgi:CMP-N-acetylneuraminic acid synthetase
MSKSDNITAVIPIRKGSQRVKNKNLRVFNKKNLLIYKIEKLKKLKHINKIIINTDSDEAINIAKDLNVDFWKRDKYFASSECSNSEFWSYIAETTKSDYIMFTNCTSPLVKIETYNKVLEKFNKIKDKNDSLNTVTEEKNFLYLDNKGLNFDPKKTPNSQNLPDIVKLNFAINILSTKLMYLKKSVIGDKPYFFRLDQVEGFDIDTPFDFEFAEYLHKKLF